ncbi:MOSC domain protein [Candidatus Rhodobacter oscarellae]|uniref:MOSC domain protein n=1 Tax=Candidatus Rhodobacter oscarellae TaxID=1675527 RepID=A0A0J9E2B1_9RHOB|nr:MOSC domain-containing protein [Candidatus Rhodobacter lobularis]KMW56870.1 MOSC domain protein [Candidatus Rhodobacter lobularis]
MTPLAELLVADAKPGRVHWIGLRPGRLQDMQDMADVEIAEAGLVGDHGRANKRAVTLFQAEHLSVLESFVGRPVAPAELRRNILVEGLNLSAFRGAELQLGGARLEITGPCAPCSRMSQALGPGGYNALRGHGGWCARVVSPGFVCIGDAVSRNASV